MKKNVSMSLRMAKPTVMPASGLKLPNCGMPMSNEPWRNGTLRSCEKVVGELIPTTVPWLGQRMTFCRFSGNGAELKGALPVVLVVLLVLVLDVLVLDVLDELLVLDVLLVPLLDVLLVPLLDVLDVLVLDVELKMGEPNCPRPMFALETLSLTLKLKFTPTDSTKSSSTVMNRHSTVTCRSWSRRNYCSRSLISS
jgi:hypothetical protein